MVVRLVHVVVASEHVDDFIRATRINHEASIREPENLRFDVLQDPDDPTRFVLYEAYESEAGAAAHRETPHYAVWRDAVEPWMAEPRRGIAYAVIAP
jgi:autoinducer 2-degrading protein